MEIGNLTDFKYGYIYNCPQQNFLEHFQLKTLHMIVDPLWYVPNTVI
jgi:hypothetical protein